MMNADGTVHFSELKLIGISPMHYAHRIANPMTTTPAMRLGTLVDMLLLTEREPIVAGDNRRSKEYLAARKLHPAEVEVFTETELERASDVVLAVRADPLACDFLGLDDPARVTQLPLRWTVQGVPMSTRGLDVVTKRRLVDLKATATAQPDRLMMQARRMGWHAQLANYEEAARQNNVDVSGGAFIVAVESRAPYPVTVLRFDAEALDEGMKTVSSWLETFKSHAATNHWPAYSAVPVDFVSYGDADLVYPDDEDAEG